MAAESQRKLEDKLGLKPGMRIAILRAPTGYEESLPILSETKVSKKLTGWFDFIQYFATSSSQLTAVMENLTKHIEPSGSVWICWPKKGSVLAGELTDNVVREIGLAAGVVDTKVVAIDQDWSALKFVLRTKDR